MLSNKFPKFLFDLRNVSVLFSQSLGEILQKPYICCHCPLFKNKFLTSLPLYPHFPVLSTSVYYQPNRYIVNQATHHYNASEVAVSIKEKATLIDKMVTSIPDKTICNFIAILADLNMSLDEIKIFLGNNPEVLRISAQNWQSVLNTLNNNGIKNKPLLKTLNNYPLILGQKPKQLSSVFESLRTMKISDNSLRQIICHSPQIVSIESSYLVKRARDLQTLFKMDDVILLIRKSPSILIEDWEIILKKFNYVFTAMGITQPQMRYSNLFCHSFDHIRTRHIWVYRTGFFKKSKHKEDKQLNPRLDKILDLSDKAFVEKFGNMSKEDYQTFAKLLQQEIKDDDDDDLDKSGGYDYYVVDKSGDDDDSDVDDDDDDSDVDDGD